MRLTLRLEVMAERIQIKQLINCTINLTENQFIVMYARVRSIERISRLQKYRAGGHSARSLQKNINQKRPANDYQSWRQNLRIDSWRQDLQVCRQDRLRYKPKYDLGFIEDQLINRLKLQQTRYYVPKYIKNSIPCAEVVSKSRLADILPLEAGDIRDTYSRIRIEEKQVPAAPEHELISHSSVHSQERISTGRSERNNYSVPDQYESRRHRYVQQVAQKPAPPEKHQSKLSRPLTQSNTSKFQLVIENRPSYKPMLTTQNQKTVKPVQDAGKREVPTSGLRLHKVYDTGVDEPKSYCYERPQLYCRKQAQNEKPVSRYNSRQKFSSKEKYSQNAKEALKSSKVVEKKQNSAIARIQEERSRLRQAVQRATQRGEDWAGSNVRKERTPNYRSPIRKDKELQSTGRFGKEQGSRVQRYRDREDR